MGVGTEIFMESLRKILIILRESDIIDIDGKTSAIPGKNVDDRHDDQRFQPLKGEFLVDLAGFNEHGHKRLALLAGVFLFLQSLIEGLRRNGIHAQQHLAKAYDAAHPRARIGKAPK